jgi:hypothetical protein
MATQQVKASNKYESETVITPYLDTGARRMATVTTAFVILQSLCHDNISKALSLLLCTSFSTHCL